VTLSVGKGYDTRYLTDAVEGGREGYYTGAEAAGEPPGIWYGAGAEALGLIGEVDAEMMTAVFAHGIDPRDPAVASMSTWGEAATLGRKPQGGKTVEQRYAELLARHPGADPEQRGELRAQAERARPANVQFYDLTLSAQKSVTLLWVACERQANDARASAEAARGAGEVGEAARLDAQAQLWAGRARAVEESLLAGHRAALDYVAENAGYVRAGHHPGAGAKWLDAHQLVAAQFLQHDSRDRDPQLHVHGPILNLAQGPDGKWRTLDGKGIYREKPAAAAIAERVTEAELVTRLGVRLEVRPDGKAREVVGIDQAEMDLFSSRRRAIGPAAEALIEQYRRETGREPSGLVRHQLYQQATLATRSRKSHDGETREGQMARWATRAQTELGRDLANIAARVFDQEPATPAAWSEQDVIERSLAAVAETHQAWTRADLLRHVSDALPGELGLAPARVRELLEGLTDKALTRAVRIDHDPETDQLPAAYQRADGSSVFARPGAERYATVEQLRGEHELRAAAVRRGAPVLEAARLEAFIAARAAAGMPFSADQEVALRGVLTSGAAVEVVSAPAGTGKSFLVGALAEVWEGGRVRGLAFGQRQADVLTEEGVRSRNIAHWLVGQQRLAEGRGIDDDEDFRLAPGDLLVVDEAQLAGNPNLVEIARLCGAAGAKLVLAGDPAQGGMGPSGGLRDVAERGISYELAEVRRFRNGWEGPASLRLRDGDTTVAREYARHGRIVAAGSLEQAETAAGRAWLADALNGHESLVVTLTNEGAARVATRLRAELVRMGRVTETGVTLGMQGTTAGVGDLVQARHPDRARGLVNRALFRVLETREDGTLWVVPVTQGPAGEQRGQEREIPADYVSEHLALGYASTEAAAIGRTVHAGYPVFEPGMDAAAGYVAATRGRETNVAFVVTRAAGADASSGETAAAEERDAVAVFSEIMTRADLDIDETRTASTQHEQSEQLAHATGTHADRMASVISDVTTGRAAGVLDALAADHTLTEADRLALAGDPAMSTLEHLLRGAELAGHDAAEVLRAAVVERDFAHAISPAQVLHARIRHALKRDERPLELVSYGDLIPPTTPEALRPALEQWAAAADQRRHELGAEVAAHPPQWAREALGPVPDEPLARAEWEHKAGWAASYREWADHADEADPLGTPPPAGLAEKHAVWQTAHWALDLIDITPDEEKMTDGRLRNRVAAYERELNWAPRYVADELEAAHQELRRNRTDATVWSAKAEAMSDPAEREQLRAAAAEAERAASSLAVQVEQLELADQARASWYAETAPTREYATRARATLEVRGVDLDAPEDRVTSEEWLEAHRAEQAEAEQHRDIREGDLDEPDTQPAHDHSTDDTDGQELLTDVPDIREVSEPDPSERADPAERRRVPRIDETAQIAERARDAVTEIDTRAGLTEPELEDEDGSAEADRAAELNRWAADDDHAADQGREHTDTDAL
jgi:conjugative relaxase-like TrwC/TraI family protein